jgi:GDP-D-mannose dehydratase
MYTNSILVPGIRRQEGAWLVTTLVETRYLTFGVAQTSSHMKPDAVAEALDLPGLHYM